MELKGIKKDEGKEPISWIPYEFLAGMSRVLLFGGKKYKKYNWTGGFYYSRLMDAMYRHLGKFEMGEDNDPEHGESHLLSIAVNCMFLYMHSVLGLGNDDRWKRTKK